MMTTLEPIYKKVCYWYVALECLLFPVMFLPTNKVILYISILSVFIVGGVTLHHSIRLHKAIPGDVPLFGLLAGTIIVLGGTVFDMAATVICSPDLSEEGNPVLLALLNHNFSLWSIYLFTFLYQMLKVSITLYLWASFLKIYPKILKSIPYGSFFTTLRWLLGAQKMSFTDFLLSKNIHYYFFFSTLSFIIFSSNFIHWYAALEWFELVPYVSETIALVLWCIFSSLLMLAVVTHFKLRQNHQKRVILEGL